MSKEKAQAIFAQWSDLDPVQQAEKEFPTFDKFDSYRESLDDPQKSEKEILKKQETLQKNLEEILKANPKYDTLKNRDDPKRILREAYRTPANHFKMYCLAQGISNEDMISLTQENPSKEALNKIRDKVDGFYDMALSKDAEKIVDFYTKLCTMTEDRLYEFRHLADPDHRNEKSINTTVLFEGSQSYIQQTLNLGVQENKIPQESKDVIKRVNEKLKDQNKSYDFNHVETLLSMVHGDFQAISAANNSKDPDTRKLNCTKISVVHAAYAQMFNQILSADLENTNQLLGAFDEQDIGSKAIKYQAEPLSPEKSRAASPYSPAYDMTTYANEVKSHSHTILGLVRPSKEYKKVYEDMERIAKAESQINEAKTSGDKDKELKAIAAVKAEYKQLAQDSQHYLDIKNPNDAKSDIRYAEILKANKIAETNMKKLNEFEEKEKAYFKGQEKFARIDKFEALNANANNRHPLNEKIGSLEAMQAHCKTLNNDMQNGSGFNIDKFTQLQAAAVFSKLGGNIFEQLTWEQFYTMADSFKDQKDVIALSEKYPEGTKISSASQLVEELNDIKTRTSMKNNAKTNYNAVEKAINKTQNKKEELKQPLKGM